MSNYLVSSESVTEGHPDKMADQVSDAVLDEVLRQDPNGRVACETLLGNGLVVVAGEITTTAYVDIPGIVRKTVREIGYTRAKYGFDCDTCGIVVSISEQSPDIAQGVDKSLETREGDKDPLDLEGAGDQGMMYGYASNETPELMPMPIILAHKLTKRMSEVRKDGTIKYLRPDGKSQVTVEYDGDKPVGIHTVLLSTQHKEGVDLEAGLKVDLLEHVVKPILPEGLVDYDTLKFYVNPTGNFVKGGPAADCGLTGRKIIVDTYGGLGRHGGGAFSGKDPSKVDRSAAYAARHMAKNAVAAGLADRIEVQVAYAIGVAHPLSLNIDTFGTEKIEKDRIIGLLTKHFDMRPGAIIERLDLRKPKYRQTAAYGHFGRHGEDFTWEMTEKADILRDEAGL